MKNTMIWDVTPCSLAEVYGRVGSKHFLVKE
jgi:hypothetical protein